MTAVVTGASGHVGAALVRALIADGRRVRAVYNSDRRALDGLDCEAVRVNVTDAVGVREALDGAEALFHCAAVVSIAGDPGGHVWRTNVEGVKTVMCAALDAGVKRVVHCSSVAAYDTERAGRTIDEGAARAVDPSLPVYDRSKYAGERAVRDAIERGLDAVIVNPTGVLGPYDFKPGRMGKVLLSLARGRIPARFDGGTDWVDVRDVARGCLAALGNGERGQNYLLGGRWASLEELFTLAERVTGRRSPRFAVPTPLARFGAPFAEAFARATRSEPLYTRASLTTLTGGWSVSHALASRALGYEPRALEETVRDTYRWFRAQAMLSETPREP